MPPGLKHPHYFFAFIFVGFFFFKAILLFMNKNETLDKVRNNKAVKIIFDMVLPTIVIGLGLTMAIKTWGLDFNLWKSFVIIKMILAFTIIPLGIVAMRKKNKMLTAVTCILLVSIIVLAYVKY
jgi:uncharacterized membrane protein SirB2